MKDTLYAFLLAVVVLTAVAILVVGSAMLPDAFAAGLLLCLSLAALTYVFRTDVKRWRENRESDAAPRRVP
ncbi:MAG: hypothetical protein OXG74_04690 [Acidobacteria bacterium]|nr:hypothetical protein [Acidobacteriota bacterium]MCY3969203.1 hypothetical protein [Acidobacteriota bacterium]